MRCLQCNAEMALIGAVPADATLPGFEHHTSRARLATKLSADCCSLAQNLSRRPVLGYERLRVSKQKALKEEQALARKSSHQASAVEKPLSGGRTANPRPDAPADKPLEPPPT